MNATPLSQSQLLRMAIVRLLIAALAFAAMFFLPAGTLFYWQAWVYMVVLLVPVAVFGLYLARYQPALLERRFRMREKEAQQSRIIAIGTVVLLAAFIIPGFDQRFGWSSVPAWLVIAADVIILLAYLLFVLTLRENQYASRIVQVEQEQRVITTGPYAIIRHPLYLAAVLIYGFSPLALGSYWAMLPAALFPAIIVARILNEEKVLDRDLAGYADYCKDVRFRMIPGIW